jgi:DNA polymerase/3'-5' exonuclease PolX
MYSSPEYNKGQMMSKNEGRVPAAVAWKVAERLCERLAPTCTQFEIAGSLRRQKPTVGDVDIVCVPTLEEPPGMLPGLGHAEPVTFLREVEAIVSGSNGAITYEVNGEAIKRLIIRLKDGTRITADIYFTRDAAQFPALLLIRTGSARHNAWLSGLAREQGMQLGSDGLKRGDQRVPCTTEGDVFTELGLGYREPYMREYDEED